MIGHPSISKRVVSYLLLAQLIGFAVAWIITNTLYLADVWPHESATFADFAEVRALYLVLGSLVRQMDGSIRVEPSAALLDEMRRAPGFKFAVFDFGSGEPLPGSSNELVEALLRGGATKPQAMWFDWAPDGKVSSPGVLRTEKTPFGRVRVATFGYAFRWYDLFYYIYAIDLEWLPVYFIFGFVTSAASAWFAVRRGLAPLRGSAEEVKRIDLNSLNQRIEKRSVPTEVLPFVEAINGALDRLVDAARQRRFTANAAHELRTSIAILSARLDAPEEPSFKIDLKRDARRIKNIVEQLLAAARLSEAHGQVDETIDLVAVAQAMVTDAALLAVKNQRSISFEAGPSPIFVRGSRSAIESVIANLIDNALRAEPAGGAVQVRVCDCGTPEVIDHGESVEDSDREIIFEPFWRKSEAVPGAGLGLAIAKEVIDEHDGRIWVEETQGGGATFKLLLRRFSAE